MAEPVYMFSATHEEHRYEIQCRLTGGKLAAGSPPFRKGVMLPCEPGEAP
jgi:hypothetical protein